MKWLTDLSIEHPWATLAVLLVLTVGAGAGLRNMESDPDVLRDLPENMPARQLYDRIGEMFPSKEMLFIGIESEALWTPEGLRQVEALTRAIEDVDVVQQVISPTNATVVVGSDVGMEIRDAADPFPETPEEAAGLRDFLVNQEQTAGTVVSEDGRVAAIMVFLQAQLATTESKAAGKVVEAMEAHKGDLTLYPAGRPMVTYFSSLKIGKETGMLTSAALLLMVALLGLLFFNGRGIGLPIGVVVASTLWTMGGMGWLGIAMTHSLEALPIMLIAIGVADGVHIVQAYMARARQTEDRKEAARLTMDDLRRPVVMTSITTGVGFLALNTSGARSIMLLGLLTCFGVMVAMLFSLTFVPAVLALLPVPKRARKAEIQERGFALQRLMIGWGRLLTRRKGLATAAIVAFIALCGVGATQVEVETSVLENFKPDDPIRVSSEFFNEHFAGVTNLQVVFEGGGADALKDPEFLARIEQFEIYARTVNGVGGSTSILPMLRSMNQVLHAGDEAYDRLPGVTQTETGFRYELDEEGNTVAVPVTFESDGKALLADYFFQLENGGKPGDLANFVTDDYADAKVTLFLTSDSKKDMDRVVGDLRAYMEQHLTGTEVEMTGMAVLMLAVNDLITRGQGLSILVSLALVLLVTSIMFRSPVLGLCNVVPLFGALFFNFGVMGLLGLDLNLMTMGVSSMAIGVGVDFAIHFVHRYRVSFAEHGEVGEALRHTMGEAGVAILMNMVAVAGGFLTLLLASFKGVMAMGLLISLIMAFSAVGALTILPLIFTGLRPKAVESYRLPAAATGLLLLLAGALALVPAPRARGAEGDAAEFMQGVLGRNAFDDMRGKATLTLTSPNGGTKVRVFHMISRRNDEGETDMAMTMVEPADMRGNGFMMLGHAGRDDDRYIYVPSIMRVNRIVGSGRKGAFMSSEFSIDDIGMPDLEEWTWTFSGDATIDGHACKVVVATPVSDKVAKATGYSKVIWTVDVALKTSRKAEYFDKQGVEFKEMVVQEIQDFGGVPFGTDMLMTNLGTDRTSRMKLEDLVIDQGVDPTLFQSPERTLQMGF